MDRIRAMTLAQQVAQDLFTLAEAYGKRHPFSAEDLAQDFATMLEHDDLEGVDLKFVKKGSREVVAEYCYRFANGEPHFDTDHLKGLPFIHIPDCNETEMRLIIHRRGKKDQYARQLRLAWTSAPEYERSEGMEVKQGDRSIFSSQQARVDSVVKWFDLRRGYGFLNDGGGRDIFFHKADIEGDPTEIQTGTEVSYIPLVTLRGIRACGVKVRMPDEAEESKSLWERFIELMTG